MQIKRVLTIPSNYISWDCQVSCGFYGKILRYIVRFLRASIEEKEVGWYKSSSE